MHFESQESTCSTSLFVFFCFFFFLFYFLFFFFFFIATINFNFKKFFFFIVYIWIYSLSYSWKYYKVVNMSGNYVFFFVDGNAGPPNYPLAQVNQKQNVVVRVTSLSPPRFFTKKNKQKLFKVWPYWNWVCNKYFVVNNVTFFFFFSLVFPARLSYINWFQKQTVEKKKKRYMNLQHRVQQV